MANPGKGTLEGKVAVITGGGRGLGPVLARSFASAGAAVFLIARTVPELETTVADIERRGGRASWARADVRDPQQTAAAIERCLATFGRIDIAINNAAVMVKRSLAETDFKTWSDVIGTNLTGPFLVAQAVASVMRRQGGGHIINIGSGAGKRGYAEMTAYSASKFGLMGLTEALAEELSNDNIKVSALVPGSITTGNPRPGRKELLPEDIASAAVMLASQSDTAWTAEMNLWPWREL